MISKKMERPVTIHEMESVAGGLGADFSISNDVGNVVEISDSSDALGFGMLANSGRMRGQNSGGNSGGPQSAPPSQNTFTFSPSPAQGTGLAEVEIGSIEPMEPITLNLGGSGGLDAPVEIQFSKAEGDRHTDSLFSNMQTSTGPGFGLTSAPTNRMNPEEEKKEKIDLLNKLQRLEKKGLDVAKRFTMDNTLEEMKQEYLRLVDSRNLEASLRFQRQALMSVVTGLEWANGRFDPFDVKLDGWSEAVHENVEDFDEIFEELYDKYKERGKMPPEARLMMALAGSGFMCHVSNTFLKSRMSSVSADDILKSNPDLAKQFAAAAAQQAGPGFGNFMNMAMGGAGGNTAQAAAPAGAGSFFGSSAQAASQAAQEAQARARAEVSFQTNVAGGGMPMNGPPQSVAAMEPPRQTARREMRGPSGVDDILRSFEAARQNESMDGTAFPNVPVNGGAQPATAAAIEIQSIASGDDIGSTTESARGGRGRRRRAPIGNSLSLDV
jgi:hypothetical protein